AGASRVITCHRRVKLTRRHAQLVTQRLEAVCLDSGLVSTNSQTIVGYILDTLIEDHVGNPLLLLIDATRHTLIVCIYRPWRFVGKASAAFIYQHAVRENEYRGLGYAG